MVMKKNMRVWSLYIQQIQAVPSFLGSLSLAGAILRSFLLVVKSKTGICVVHLFVQREKLQATIQDIAKTQKEIKMSSINTVDQGCVKAKGRQGTHVS